MMKSSFALGAVLLLSAGAALAQAPEAARPNPGPNPGQRMFEQLDANRDNRLTWDEAWGFATARFNAADADRSGGVSLAEFASLRGLNGGSARPEADPVRQAEQRQRMEQRRGAMFRSLDVNGDGQVTLAEMQPFAQARFRAMDANADGAISRDELPQPGPGRHRNGQPAR